MTISPPGRFSRLWARVSVWGQAMFLAAGCSVAGAREGTPPPSWMQSVRPLAELHRVDLLAVDPQAELAADAKRPALTPLRFAAGRDVHLTPQTSGTWEQTPEGRLWRVRLSSPGATDLNLGFTTFWLPEGATLHVGSETDPYYQGPYTSRDNKPHGQLWTPLLPGSAAVVELFVPASAQYEPQIVLSRVGAGYRDFFKRKGLVVPFAEGTCNNDVVCPVAAAWSNEVRSVGVYSVEGLFACTGTLVANTAGNFRNFFLTANHCDVTPASAPTVVVYWNYQSATCGTHGPGALGQNQSGATWRAAKYDVDFCLLELDEAPDALFNVYYSGWDRSGTAPTGAVGIHHPDCDVKAISFSSQTLVSVLSCIGTGTGYTHWRVTWYSGVTEPGSSGSGLWNPANHLLVGTLSGGDSSCATPTLPDCYGKFSSAWASGTSATNRLRDWLDPQNTGVFSIPGTNASEGPSVIVPNGMSLIAESCVPTNGFVDGGEAVTMDFGLRHLAGMAVTNLVATLLATNGVLSPGPSQEYGALLAGGPAVSRPFTFTASGSCGSSIAPVLQLADGGRNLGTATFGTVLGEPILKFKETFDGVSAPTLPAGWTSAGSDWYTVAGTAHTLPNAAFTLDPGSKSDRRLVSPSFWVTNTTAQVSFRHYYNTEAFYDGGVLEISISGGTYADILSAGGSFVTGGYSDTINSANNALNGRSAWTGDSGGFVPVIANLPATAAGHTAQLRWRLGSDSSVSGMGWYVDTVVVTDGYACCTSPPLIVNPRKAGLANFAFSFDTVTGQTYYIERSTNLLQTNWITLKTNAGDGARQAYTNSPAPTPRSFYRLRTK